MKNSIFTQEMYNFSPEETKTTSYEQDEQFNSFAAGGVEKAFAFCSQLDGQEVIL